MSFKLRFKIQNKYIGLLSFVEGNIMADKNYSMAPPYVAVCKERASWNMSYLHELWSRVVLLGQRRYEGLLLEATAIRLTTVCSHHVRPDSFTYMDQEPLACGH